MWLVGHLTADSSVYVRNYTTLFIQGGCDRRRLSGNCSKSQYCDFVLNFCSSSSAFTSDLAAGLGEACNRFLVSESPYEEKRSGMLADLVSELCL